MPNLLSFKALQETTNFEAAESGLGRTHIA